MGRMPRRLLVATLLVAGCGGGSAGAPTTPAPTRPPSPPTTEGVTTVAPATTPTPSTVPSSTTTSTTSTSSTTTTTLPPLPVPIAPPPEDGTADPVVELGQLEIPSIGLTRPMYEGIRLATLDRGPGHWPGTAMPGELGNVVVAGHRVSTHRDFNQLDRLRPGDEVVMSTLTGRHVYRVTGTEIVQPDAMWIVEQTYERRATLFACHPLGSVAERIVVHLELST